MTTVSFLPRHPAHLGRDHQRFHNADLEVDEPLGDCWPTAVASVLGLPRDAVPHFTEDTRYAGHWWTATQEWLAGRGLTMTTHDDRRSAACWSRFGIESGPSPRGDWLHAVVVDLDTGVMLHDPHPSGIGTAGPGVEWATIYPSSWDDLDMDRLIADHQTPRQYGGYA